MTREQRLELLKQIEKDIYVPSIESTFLDDAKSCAIHSVIEELEQEPILDKIREEIETKYGQCKLTEYIVQYDGICTGANDMGDIADILQIIDKYKAETGAEDGNNNL